MMAKFWPNCEYDYTNFTYQHLDKSPIENVMPIIGKMLPFNKARTKAITRIGPHNKQVLDIIICGMLGDFGAEKITGNLLPSIRFNIEQSISNTAYIHHLTLLFYNLGYCARPIPTLVPKSDKEIENRFKYRLSLFTFTNFIWIYDSFYKTVNGKTVKCVPFYIGYYLSPIGLAHLLMQIGSPLAEGLILKPKFKNISDLIIIKNLLYSKYNIQSQIKLNEDGNLNILIDKISSFNLSIIVKPYLPFELFNQIFGTFIHINSNLKASISDLDLVSTNNNTNISPVKSYLDADISKELIIKENKNQSGVYRWTHKKSGQSYIGSSINLNKRFINYYSFKYITDPKKTKLIHKALLKYGYSAFKLDILEYCKPENLINREQYYLDLFKPNLNILTIAGSKLGSEHKPTILKCGVCVYLRSPGAGVRP